jgi:CubicO group peptidase (beta-lactamase class C family)
MFYWLMFILFPILTQASNLELKNELLQIIKDNKIPGMMALYHKDHQIEELVSVGKRKFDKKAEIKITDNIHLGSCAKSMTAMVAHILADEGILKLDEPIQNYLPELKFHPELNEITLNDLLTHSSGLAANTTDEEERLLDQVWVEPKSAREFLAKKYLANKPQYQPKSKWIYSNLGYMFAGFVMEHLTQTSWETLLNLKLLAPLGMSTCRFGPTSTLTMYEPKNIWGHRLNDDGKITAHHDDNITAFAPAGTLNCSILDYNKYLELVVDGYNGESNYLSDESFKHLFAVNLKDSDYTFGGWFKYYREWNQDFVLFHNGTNTYNMLNTWVIPNRKSFVTGFTNIGGKKAYTANEKAILNIFKRRIK